MDYFYSLESLVNSDWLEYDSYGGPEGIDRYNYWMDEAAAAHSCELSKYSCGEYYEYES